METEPSCGNPPDAVTVRRVCHSAALALLAGLSPASFAEEAPSPAPEIPQPAEAPQPAYAEAQVLGEIRAELDRLSQAQARLRRLLETLLGARWPKPPEAGQAPAASVPTGPGAPPQDRARGFPAGAAEPDFLEDPADALYRRARAAFESRNFYDSENLLREVLADHPRAGNIGDIHYWLGESLYQQGRYRDSIEQFEHLLGDSDSPWWTRAQLRAGYAWYELGEYERARALLVAVRDSDPDSRISQLAQLRLERLERLQQNP